MLHLSHPHVLHKRAPVPFGQLIRKRSLHTRPVVVVHADQGKDPQEFGLAPARLKTAHGEMLQYYLKMEPQLFKAAVEEQLRKLKAEKEAKDAERQGGKEAKVKDPSELVLYKRLEELRAAEVRATVEDLMYVSILEKFIILGVKMLPRMDGFVDPAPTNLKALTELHSKEALELVKDHLRSVMGPATMDQYSNAMLKMSKFQMAQVYAASVMFGYFLRRVDQRFQLEKQIIGMPNLDEDPVARLERLFAKADIEDVVDMDAPLSSSSSTSGSSLQASSSASSQSLPAKKQKSALRQYVEKFDQVAMVEMARIVSSEGAALVERQTSALVGDIKKLTKQVQEVVGKDASSMEEVMSRMAKAVETDKVETLTMSVGTQKRAVLEAVAFGTFLRDVETWVHQEYTLLTPLPPPKLPPGAGSTGSTDEE